MDTHIAIHSLKRSGSGIITSWLAQLFPRGALVYNNSSRPSFYSYQGSSYPVASAPARVPHLHRRTGHRMCDSAKGLPTDTIHLLVMRDWINLAASKCRQERQVMNMKAGTIKEVWLSHYYEFSERTTHLGRNLFALDFNQFAEHSAYRREAAASIGVPYHALGIFQHLRDKNVSYKRSLEDTLFWEVVMDEKVWEASQRGWPEVTQDLLSCCSAGPGQKGCGNTLQVEPEPAEG